MRRQGQSTVGRSRVFYWGLSVRPFAAYGALMATKEEQETLRLLVQQVSRAFYEPKYTIILDQLARHPV